MRRIERIAALGGIMAAFVLALAWNGGGTAAEASGQPAAGLRIATFDIFLTVERLMKQPELDKARTDMEANYTARLTALERELQAMQTELRGVQQNSPQAEAIINRGEAKHAEYQRIAQDKVQDLEKINSQQLIQTYNQARVAAAVVAQRKGYSHVVANRGFDKLIEANNVAAALQEFLARPILVGIPADDITADVMTDLKLQP